MIGDLLYFLIGIFVLFCYSITIEYFARKPEYHMDFAYDGKAQLYFGAVVAAIFWFLSFPCYLAWLGFVCLQKAAKKIAAKLDNSPKQ